MADILLSITINQTAIDHIWRLYCGTGLLAFVEGVTINYYYGIDWKMRI